MLLHTVATILHTVATILPTADCDDGEVRLMEGVFEWEGRLEVCFGQRWGTISSDGWTDVNSHVVCNDLGYDFDTGITQRTSTVVFHSGETRLVFLNYVHV